MAAIRPGMINNWDLMERQVQFYRDHLDIFIEQQFPPFRLTDSQHIILRQFGRSDDMATFCSRGFGKTLCIALGCFAVCCLYPGTYVAVTSSTAQQATLILQKIKELLDQNANMRAEVTANGSRTLVRLSKDKGIVEFKNGSKIQSFAMDSLRGQRAKICVADEALQMKQADIDAILAPVRNARRLICQNYGFKDFPSKIITISSAPQKSNDAYANFRRIVGEMAKGTPGAFACALDYRCAADQGITDPSFFEKQRASKPQSTFDLEYGTICIGEHQGSAFPWDITDTCRTLKRVQLQQPKNSHSRYVMSIDLATSEAKTADNTIISVLKFTQRTDGSYMKKLVYLRSFHGQGLDVIARQARRLFHLKFPNCEKIIYDARGLGDSFPKFFDQPWIDELGKQYPPLVQDDQVNLVAGSLVMLHPVRAVAALNQRVYSNMRVALEKRTIEFPVSSRKIVNGQLEVGVDQNGELAYMTVSPQELGIYQQADALQFEMGNVVAKVSAAGNVLYDTSSSTQHKDRYSSVSYGVDYIAQLEKQNIKRKNRGPACVGFASYF